MNTVCERKAPQLKYFLTWVVVRICRLRSQSANWPDRGKTMAIARYGIAESRPALPMSKPDTSARTRNRLEIKTGAEKMSFGYR